jgi:hypothetical protein
MKLPKDVSAYVNRIEKARGYENMIELALALKNMNDPIVNEYLKSMSLASNSDRKFGIATPLHALGEKRVAIHVLAVKDAFDVRAVKPGVDHNIMCKILALLMYKSPVIYIKHELMPVLSSIINEISNQKINETNMPRNKRLPFNSVYVSQEYRFNFSPKMESEDAKEWMSRYEKFCLEDGSLEFDGIFVQAEVPNVPSNITGILYPTDERKGLLVPLNADSGARWFIDALCLFMESKISRKTSFQPNRQMRKQIKETEINLDENLNVNVIELRHFEKHSTTGTTGEGRTYDFQWLVSGHIRNQYYPSTKEHELIWVEPYIKGPEGKPFKEAVRYVKR